MDIPEIYLEVATYLHLSDLSTCALVCREWNDAFTPLLYHDINYLLLGFASIQRHCVHARKLSVSMDHPLVESLIAGPATHVRELVLLRGNRIYPSFPLPWVSLLRQNPEIFKMESWVPIPHILVEIMPNLRELALHNLSFRSIPQPPNIWQVYQRLTRLELKNCPIPAVLPEQPLDTGPDSLPAMRHLVIYPRSSQFWHSHDSRSSIFNQIWLISVCPNLETLHWGLYILPEEQQDLKLETLLTVFRSFDRLRELSLYMPKLYAPHSLGKDWPRKLLEIVRPLRLFYDTIERAGDSKEGLVKGSLSRHFGSLVELFIGGWAEVTSADNHLILTSCPCLQTFESWEYEIGRIPTLNQSTLTVSGQHSGSALGPLGWVCTRLSKIKIEFIHETPEKNRMMFDQLSCMKYLEMMELGASGLDPELIQWDSEATTLSWESGGHFLKESDNSNSWARKIWPKLKVFRTY